MNPETLYEDDEVIITSEDVDNAIENVKKQIPLLAQMLEAEVLEDDNLLG